MTGAAVVVGVVVLAPAGRLLRAGADGGSGRRAGDRDARDLALGDGLERLQARGAAAERARRRCRTWSRRSAASCSISPPRRTGWRRSASTRWSAWCARGRADPSAAPSRWRRWPPPPGCWSWRASTGTTPFRSDQMIYGRYNEATLAADPGGRRVALVTAPLDPPPDRRDADADRGAVDVPQLVWDAALRGQRAGQLQHPRRRAGGRPR